MDIQHWHGHRKKPPNHDQMHQTNKSPYFSSVARKHKMTPNQALNISRYPSNTIHVKNYGVVEEKSRSKSNKKNQNKKAYRRFGQF